MDILTGFVTRVIGLLPDSPFQAYLEGMQQIDELRYLNYFIPVDAFVAIGETWVVTMGLWMAYSFVMRLAGKG